jgi:hypothetical protein
MSTPSQVLLLLLLLLLLPPPPLLLVYMACLFTLCKKELVRQYVPAALQYKYFLQLLRGRWNLTPASAPGACIARHES